MADNPKIVVNSLLTYCFHCTKCFAHDDIKNVLLDFYSGHVITEAKKILWEEYSDCLPTFEKRVCRGLRSVEDKEIDDILKALKSIDEKYASCPMPTVFAAIELNQLPPCMPMDHAPLAIIGRMQRMEQKLASLEAMTDISTTNAKRLDSLERNMVDLKDEIPRSKHPAPYAEVVQSTSEGQSRDLTYELPPPLQLQLQQQIPQGPHRQQRQMQQHHEPSEQGATSRPPPAQTDDDGFTQVGNSRRKRLKRKTVYGTKKDAELKSGKRQAEFFIFRVDKEATDDMVRNYVETGNIEVQKLECLSKPEAFSKSFYLSVTTDDPSQLLDPSFWPDGVGCRRFYKKKASEEKQAWQ